MAVNQLCDVRLVVVRVLILAVLLAIACAGLLALQDTRNDYGAVVIDKLSRIERLGSPKIVTIGGSSAAFGVDSRMLEEAFGMPTVNMGIHAGIGLRFMLHSVEPYLGRGDVVFLSPEYELVYGPQVPGDVLYGVLWYLPDARRYLPSRAEYVRFLLVPTVQRLQQTFLYLVRFPLGLVHPDAVYGRQAFDVRGDIQAHVGQLSQLDPTIFDHRPKARQAVDAPTLQLVYDFVAAARRGGASVIVVYPPHMTFAHEQDVANIGAVDAALRAALGTTAAFPTTPETFVYPPAYFFDSVYHLTADGRTARTHRLIELVRPFMPKE